jgi:hypothetical protein
MKQKPIEEGRFSQHAHGLGTVSEAMVRQRAAELAVINGRSARQVLDSDLAQARRELTGQERLNPEPSPAERLPEESRWEAVPESAGQPAPTVSASAEQDQMVRATKQSLRQRKV